MQSFEGALLAGCFGDLCGGFVGERPRWSVTSIKLHGGFVGVALQRWCSPVGLFRIFRDAFSREHLWRAAFTYGIPIIYINVFPSTHLAHHMCVLTH